MEELKKNTLQMNSTKLLSTSDNLVSINQKISKSKKTLVLTGAGISCNAGIPDFRSSNGLYNMNPSSKPIKGKDLFDISLFQSPETIEDFAIFMSNLYSETQKAKPTRTHKFISSLSKENKLLRCYTQNIDGLEAKLGLKMDFDQHQEKTMLQTWKNLDVVQLHGDLNTLSCTTCLKTVKWDQESYESLQSGELPDCPHCISKRDERIGLGKRVTYSLGRLRPNIVLYGENHPFSEIITMGLNSDLKARPDLFLIMGTSLKVHGVKSLVKSMSQAVHSKNGIVVLVNKDILSGWNGIIDYQIQSDCDEFIQNYELFKAQQQQPTPPVTPKNTCRVIDLLNTPSPQKKRKISVLQDPKSNSNNNNTYLTPEESPKKSPRVLKQLNFDLNESKQSPAKPYRKMDLQLNQSPKKSPQKKVLKELHDYSDMRRSPRIKRIRNLLNHE